MAHLSPGAVVRALYDTAGDGTTPPLSKDELLTVVEAHDTGWLEVEKEDGTRGYAHWPLHTRTVLFAVGFICSFATLWGTALPVVGRCTREHSAVPRKSRRCTASGASHIKARLRSCGCWVPPRKGDHRAGCSHK